MSKVIQKFDPEVVKKAVDRIAEPVVQTLTPLGNNVLFEKDLHSVITNDGVTIAKLIDSEDEVEDAIIQMVKYGALSTNRIAGDGTTSTILYTKKLIELGLDELERGVKPMALKNELISIKDSILEKSEKLKKDVTEADYYNIAYISSGGDETLSQNVVDVIGTAGLDGMVFLNESKSGETRIIKDTGYNLDEKMFDPVLGNLQPGQADYQKPSVFITDKKLYHIEECKEILEYGHKQGIKDFVIVARDFIGEAPEFLIANHLDQNVPLNVLLVKYRVPDNNFTPLHDLATYLGGKVVTEKRGSLRGNLRPDDYIVADRVYSAGEKTVFVTNQRANPELTMLVDNVRKEKDQDPDNDLLSKRLASLTAGTVNVEVGGPTGPETRELIYRYEDAINAVRASLRSGYVTGGGLGLLESTKGMGRLAEAFGSCSVEQIAYNCGIDYEPAKYNGERGYNAKTGEYCNLAGAGVIEPYDVFRHSVINAFSVAIAILTSGYFIVNKVVKDKE